MYNSIVDINKNFQTSVNVDYDLGNSEKVKEHIPTSDVCDVLKVYFKSLLKIEKNNATILVGPYGKGKSFLILVLLQLICFEYDKNTELLLNKIKQVDKELYDLIKRFNNDNKKYLPIVIDSNYYNIEQSFLLSLSESLMNAKLSDIIPNTVYSVCLELLDKWERDKETYSKTLELCNKKYKISIKELRQELEHFDIAGYRKFEDIYNCVTPGLRFNPMINSDVVKIYADVNRQLFNHGYEGMFIIYDEFNKTLEAKNEYLSKDLKIIQDFAEKANRSAGEEQLHLCCITHKSLALYQDRKNNLLDSFKTVEGRFKEIRFNRSLDQNYQIISFSINKNKDYKKIVNSFISKNKKFITELEKTVLFEEINIKELLEGSFPFNPVSEYALIQLSELVAQNERTMFTLISDNDENSFSSFVTNNNEGLYNLDKLYDYFNKSLSSDEGEIKTIWYKCESSLLQVKKNIQKRILKSLACIRMINDFAKLPPDTNMIALSLFEDYEDIKKEVEELIDKKIIKKSFGNSNLDFALSNSKEIDNAIDNYLILKKNYKKDTDILDLINKNKFLIPRRYNAENKITRFFRSIFVSEEEFFNINSFDIYFQQSFCDGIVINLLKTKRNKKDVIDSFNQKRKNEKVILRVSSKNDEDIISEARRVDALISIKDNNEFDAITKSQIEIILKEKEKETSSVLESLLKTSNSYVVDKYGSKELSKALENVCNHCYVESPIVNNEMINREAVSTAYKKSRDKIISNLLNRQNPYEIYSKTSPEITVYNSFFDDYNKTNKQTGVIANVIKQRLKNEAGNHASLVPIVSELKNSPYGIRTGVLPIYFAVAIANLSDNTILYFENVEIDINANNIDKFCHFPEKYSILVEKKTKKQEDYLNTIIISLNGVPTDSYYSNLHMASSLLNKWFVNLPICLKEISNNDNYLKLPENFFIIREMFLKFNINDYETMLKQLPEVFNGSYKKVLSFIDERNVIFENIHNFSETLAKQVKTIFYKGYEGSLNGCIKEWLTSEKITIEGSFMDGDDKNIAKCIGILSYDDVEAINQLSSAIIKYRIEDWSRNNTDTVISSIKSFKTNVSSSEKLSKQKEIVQLGFTSTTISSMGEMFRNNIETIVEEFNNSISNEEKAYILTQIIKDMTGE